MSVLETFVDTSLVLSVGRVKVVFDAVVRSARQILGNIGPLVAKFLVQVKNLLLLNLIDGSLVNVRVQVIVPPAFSPNRN